MWISVAHLTLNIVFICLNNITEIRTDIVDYVKVRHSYDAVSPVFQVTAYWWSQGHLVETDILTGFNLQIYRCIFPVLTPSLCEILSTGVASSILSFDIKNNQRTIGTQPQSLCSAWVFFYSMGNQHSAIGGLSTLEDPCTRGAVWVNHIVTRHSDVFSYFAYKNVRASIWREMHFMNDDSYCIKFSK